MNRIVWLMLASLVVLAGLLLLLLRPEPEHRPNPGAAGAASKPSNEPLIVFCAASNRPVLEAIKADYEDEFGVTMQIEYGASQTILASHDPLSESVAENIINLGA